MEYKSNIWVAIMTLLVGVALIFLRGVAAATVVIILGAMFIATGALTAMMQYNRRDDKGKRKLSFTDIITALAAVILGIWMVTDPSGNINVIVTLIGIIAAIAGGFQIFSMLITWHGVSFPKWFYITPALILGCGVFMICSPSTFTSALVLITGIALVVYAISSMMQVFTLMSFEKQMRDVGAASYAADDRKGEHRFVEEVSATEVKPADDNRQQTGGAWPADRR